MASENSKPEILIIGANGHVGSSTLTAIARDRRNSNFRIIGACRNVEQAKGKFDAFGVDLVHVDLDDSQSLIEPVRTATKIFFIPANDLIHRIHHAKSLLEACKQAEKLEHLVLLSILECEKGNTMQVKEFKLIEDMFKNSSTMKCTVLRSAFYMENLIGMEDLMKDQSKIVLPIRDAKFSPVSVADIGEAASNVLLSNTENFADRTFTLTGRELLSGGDIADALGKIMGKELQYVTPPKEEAKREFVENIGMDPLCAEALLEILESTARGEHCIVSYEIEELLGRKAEDFSTVMNRNKCHFFSKSRCICPI